MAYACTHTKTHDHLICDLVGDILPKVKPHSVASAVTGGLSTVAYLFPGVTPDTSHSAAVIKSRANIGKLINPLECSSAF